MCGIAGRILNAPGRVGNDLVELMDAQEHRGADSTGFAVYGAPRDTGYVLRGMGFDKSRLDADMADFRDVLREHGSDWVEEPTFVECTASGIVVHGEQSPRRVPQRLRSRPPGFFPETGPGFQASTARYGATTRQGSSCLLLLLCPFLLCAS